MGGLNIHIIIGADEYLVSGAAKKIVGDGEGLEVVDSAEATNCDAQLRDIGRVKASLMTPPFLEPRKVTWWKNVGFLPHGEKMAEDAKLALEGFADFLAGLQLTDNHHFVLTGSALRKDSIFAKKLATACEMVVFGSPKPWDAARMAAVRADEFAEELGLKFEPGAAEHFAGMVAADARTQKSEVAKLRDYLGPKRNAVTVADVDAVVCPGAEPMLWSVTDAIGDRNASVALREMARFKNDSGYAVFMTTIIEKFFREMVGIKDALARGQGGEALAGKRPQAVGKIKAQLVRWSLRELRVARFRFLRLRELAVSTCDGIESLIDAEVVRTLAK